MNENAQFGYALTVDQQAFQRLPQAQQQQLHTDLQQAIQQVQSKYNNIQLSIQSTQPTTLHEVAHQR